MTYDAAVIGAGPAGSAVALLLARAGRRVFLADKGEPGRAKVCGGFLGPEFLPLVSRLGLDSSLDRLPHARIDTLVLTERRSGVIEAPLPGAALGVDRPALDRWLFDAAVRAGAVPRTGEEAAPGPGGVRLASGENVAARRVVNASGRRPYRGAHSAFYGVKAVFRGAPLPGRIALHLVGGGNVGMNPVDGERTVLCAYADASHVKRAHGDFDAMIAAFRGENPHLDRALSAAAREGAWQACQAEADGREAFYENGVFRVGDAVAMMHPLVGGGIGMAVGSACLLAPLLERDGAGDAALAERYRREWRALFSGRVRLSARLGSCQRSRVLTRALLAFFRGCPAALDAVLRLTRPLPV